MKERLAASDWRAGRGEKWRAQLTGMEATLAAIDAPLIEALKLDAPYRIADIGCGGGGTTLEILRRAPSGSTVRGFDLSPALIEAARGRIGPGSRAAFDVADASTSAPPDGPYHRLLSRFGIMFFDDPDAAFTNLASWLAPGGRFAFAAWGGLADNPWMTVVRDAVAEVVELPRPDPDAPGPFRYSDPGKLLAVLERSGYTGLDVTGWQGMLPMGGGLPAAEAADFALASFGSFSEMLADAGSAAVEEARRRLTDRLIPCQKNGAVLMEAGVHLFTGARATGSELRFR